MESTVLEIVQIEVHTKDIERSIEFYSNVFGWRPVPAQIQNCVVLKVPETNSWGVSLIPNSNLSLANKNLIIYFKTAHAESIAQLASKFGGASHFGPSNLPSYGTIWQISDPDGNRFGLFKTQSF
jgi:predicted enzyme related to lactoylglutathione lyase